MKLNRFILVVSFLLIAISGFSQKSINIWEDTDCNKKVKLTPYLAEGDNNIAVIVCPGGSYFWLDRKTEGIGVAEWLQSNGISAFVLEYRVVGVPAFITHYRLLFRGIRFPDMLQDILRSIQLIRDNANQYGINPNKLGVMGFSAGGHLAGMSGEFFDTDVLSLVGIKTSTSLKPDFIAPIYPVVSFVNKSTHKRSQRGILGEGHSISKEMKDSLSLERHVRSDMPPTFLMNCVDDPIVKYHNSELLDSAMTAKDVNHRYIQYKTGGHGFGATPEKTSEEAIGWREEFLNWVKFIFKKEQ
ncbi:alpha/beta hydrolase [Bacteroides caecimuris]|uniref:alpha/beta hydrolase n=1 Tax=Bacteroides caecimuris TaxID=1796613 RepID=UPI00265AD443|nr:alpha/beta hydrolase [Bacteroides caecimuris]